MTSAAEELKQVLEELPYGDRAELVHFLVGTLSHDLPVSDLSQGESLDDTLRRRLKEIQDGTAVGEPAFEAIARLRKKHS